MPTERPGILTTIAIIGIVLGSFGVLGSLVSAASAVFQDQLSNLQPTAELQESQRQLSEQIREISAGYFVPAVLGSLANFVASVLLILSGALLLAGKPVGAGLMMKTVAAAIVVDLYNTSLAVYVQIMTMPLMGQTMRAAAAAAAAAEDLPPQADAAMDSVMSAAVWAGAAFSVFWLICKLAYYIVAIVALRMSDVKAWLAERSEI